MSELGLSPEGGSSSPVEYDLTKISTSTEPYGEVGMIFSDLLTSRTPSAVRLQVLDDKRGLLATIGYGAYEPGTFDPKRRETSIRIASRIIAHNKENVPGYKEEEMSWIRIVDPMYYELVRFETSQGATDPNQLAAFKMAKVLGEQLDANQESTTNEPTEES